MMIKIIKHKGELLLAYHTDSSPWVAHKPEENGLVRVSLIFSFTKEETIHAAGQAMTQIARTIHEEFHLETEGTSIFLLGVLDNGFFRIKSSVLGLEHDLRIEQSIEVKDRFFRGERNANIMALLESVISRPIIIGSREEDSISEKLFKNLLTLFPKSTEVKRYVETRTKAEEALLEHLNKKRASQPDTGIIRQSIAVINEIELTKFTFIKEQLLEMLGNLDGYDEKQWQDRILEIILLLFPKYVAVLEKVHLKDFYSNPKKPKSRRIDIALVDANGFIDIIEIKKPTAGATLRAGKYRGNHTPSYTLSGTIMQAEKYLFHLSKWGKNGEDDLQRRKRSELPTGLKIKISNPKAMLIYGRDNEFDEQQKLDFEIIRRKYADMMDIITYDDLLRRIENILSRFS